MNGYVYTTRKYKTAGNTNRNPINPFLLLYVRFLITHDLLSFCFSAGDEMQSPAEIQQIGLIAKNLIHFDSSFIQS